jgi:hypothetical protein
LHDPTARDEPTDFNHGFPRQRWFALANDCGSQAPGERAQGSPARSVHHVGHGFKAETAKHRRQIMTSPPFGLSDAPK